MTVSSNTRRAGPLACNGSLVAFDFDFTTSDDDDIQVILATSAGVETVLTKTTHYTVALNADQTSDPGGTVTTVSTYASGYTITILGALAYNQQTALTNLGGFFPTVINSALDKATILIQQIKEILDRTLRLPASSSASTELPAPSAGKAIGWNATEDGLTNIASLTGVAVSTFMETVLDDTTAGDARTTLGLGALSTLATVGTSQIDADAVTYAKLQDVAAYSFIGNATGSTATPTAVAMGSGTSTSGTTMRIQQRYEAQTVIYGPVDSSGFASFGGSTGSTTVTMSGGLIAVAGAGFGTYGSNDLVGYGLDLSWTGLSTNGTMYLYVDVASGVLTTGSTTLEPVYQWGGVWSTTNGQFTYNIQERVAKVGNGSTATQVYRVFVGQVTVSGGVTSAITWYALRGKYKSAFVSTLPAAGVKTSYTHNLGVPMDQVKGRILGKNLTGEFGYTAGMVAELLARETASGISGNPLAYETRLVGSATAGSAATSWQAINMSSGSMAALTAGNWSLGAEFERAW